MAKLSEGNMNTTEAMYHAKGLIIYYNRSRHQQLNIPGEDDNRTLAITDGHS